MGGQAGEGGRIHTPNTCHPHLVDEVSRATDIVEGRRLTMPVRQLLGMGDEPNMDPVQLGKALHLPETWITIRPLPGYQEREEDGYQEGPEKERGWTEPGRRFFLLVYL